MRRHEEAVRYSTLFGMRQCQKNISFGVDDWRSSVFLQLNPTLACAVDSRQVYKT